MWPCSWKTIRGIKAALPVPRRWWPQGEWMLPRVQEMLCQHLGLPCKWVWRPWGRTRVLCKEGGKSSLWSSWEHGVQRREDWVSGKTGGRVQGHVGWDRWRFSRPVKDVYVWEAVTIHRADRVGEVASPVWRGSLMVAGPQVEGHSQALKTGREGVGWQRGHLPTLLLTKPIQSQGSREPTDGLHMGWRRARAANEWERQGEDTQPGGFGNIEETNQGMETCLVLVTSRGKMFCLVGFCFFLSLGWFHLPKEDTHGGKGIWLHWTWVGHVFGDTSVEQRDWIVDPWSPFWCLPLWRCSHTDTHAHINACPVFTWHGPVLRPEAALLWVRAGLPHPCSLWGSCVPLQMVNI